MKESRTQKSRSTKQSKDSSSEGSNNPEKDYELKELNKASRSAIFTLNNYYEDEVKEINNWEVKYLIYGFEVAPTTGTPHLQGYVEWHSPKKFSTMKNLNNRIHWYNRKLKGTPQQCADYCKKDGKYVERGKISEQGKRNDIDEILIPTCNAIISNKVTLNQVVKEDPRSYHIFGRTFEKCDQIRDSELPARSEMPLGLWFYGPTACGKSHKAYNYINCKPGDRSRVYVHPIRDKGWWDNYRQQEVIILDEFRGQIAYEEMLQLIDKWPYQVPRRNRTPVEVNSPIIIITSSMSPTMVYGGRADEVDSFNQLLRRVRVFEGRPKGNDPSKTEWIEMKNIKDESVFKREGK